jgi:hypothetical protein
VAAENPIHDEALAPYGFVRGEFDRWCVTCRRVMPGMGQRAFKCRSCAADAFRAVERATEKKQHD